MKTADSLRSLFWDAFIERQQTTEFSASSDASGFFPYRRPGLNDAIADVLMHAFSVIVVQIHGDGVSQGGFAEEGRPIVVVVAQGLLGDAVGVSNSDGFQNVW